MERNRIAQLMDRAYEEARPVTAQLELTYKCNLLCSFCYNAPQERRELDGSQWIDTIRKCKDAGSVYVILTGGEPMVHREFWEIAQAVRELGLVLKVYTNGVLLADADKAQRYAALHPFETEISLHGSTKGVHDRLTGIRGSFDKIVMALEHLSRLDIKVTLKTPITRLNQHQLVDVERLGARFWLQDHVRYQHPADRRRRPKHLLARGRPRVPGQLLRRSSAARRARAQPAAGREDEAQLRNRPDDRHAGPLRRDLPLHRLPSLAREHSRGRRSGRALVREGRRPQCEPGLRPPRGRRSAEARSRPAAGRRVRVLLSGCCRARNRLAIQLLRGREDVRPHQTRRFSPDPVGHGRP
ncbi:MAG: radical SAM protein [Acidobacteria bacterium]|nr:radical SAM protein [Acidobacteriota bacterium]